MHAKHAKPLVITADPIVAGGVFAVCCRCYSRYLLLRRCISTAGRPRFALRFSALTWDSKLPKTPADLTRRDQFVPSFRRTDHWHLVISPPIERSEEHTSELQSRG